jgi:hypothetical protein
MKPMHWMWIGALTSALGLTGPAIGHDTRATLLGDETVSDHPTDSPASGAIVTPEDKAFGLGKHEQARSQDSDEDASKDGALRVIPPPSNDDESSVVPGASSDEGSIADPRLSDPDDTTGARRR